jgi:hypothetical protein
VGHSNVRGQDRWCSGTIACSNAVDDVHEESVDGLGVDAVVLFGDDENTLDPLLLFVERANGVPVGARENR